VIDPRKLRPSELCRLLNSSPLGEVINEGQLRRHRTRAGLRLGSTGHVDLVRYVAWLVQGRHALNKNRKTVPRRRHWLKQLKEPLRLEAEASRQKGTGKSYPVGKSP
jgi:hypothetical protein